MSTRNQTRDIAAVLSILGSLSAAGYGAWDTWRDDTLICPVAEKFQSSSIYQAPGSDKIHEQRCRFENAARLGREVTPYKENRENLAASLGYDSNLESWTKTHGGVEFKVNQW